MVLYGTQGRLFHGKIGGKKSRLIGKWGWLIVVVSGSWKLRLSAIPANKAGGWFQSLHALGRNELHRVVVYWSNQRYDGVYKCWNVREVGQNANTADGYDNTFHERDWPESIFLRQVVDLWWQFCYAYHAMRLKINGMEWAVQVVLNSDVTGLLYKEGIVEVRRNYSSFSIECRAR